MPLMQRRVECVELKFPLNISRYYVLDFFFHDHKKIFIVLFSNHKIMYKRVFNIHSSKNICKVAWISHSLFALCKMKYELSGNFDAYHQLTFWYIFLFSQFDYSITISWINIESFWSILSFHRYSVLLHFFLVTM